MCGNKHSKQVVINEDLGKTCTLNGVNLQDA